MTSSASASVRVCIPWWNEYTLYDVTHSYVDITHSWVCTAYHGETNTLCMTGLIHMSTLLIRRCDMAHSYVWQDSSVCATWLINMCDMSHLWVCALCHGETKTLCMTRLMHMCNITHSCVRHDSFICVTWVEYIQRKHSDHVTHSYVKFICVTWLA